MLLLIAGFISAAGLVWGFIYSLSWPSTLALVLKMIFRDFIALALLSAFIFYQTANRLLLSTSATGQREKVEFAYAFDVAVNAFWPLFLTLYLGLLPLAALVVRRNWGSLFLGNSLFLLALGQYVYVTYLGYSALPFVARAELFLAPLLPLVVGWVLSLLGLNVARWALETYFGRPW
ncbi:transport-related protein [Trichosporon asahii var. asahii CBS 8904]|uniref:Transport-related protein n=1 Tax=Trichosporon asahii var. asahii (strain CBS 8904) TaxID=1220162 RepID=K1VJI9_TRIAC|nr:transport-related protein [Trichosporon asahii var. asahii CBS 8904]